MFKVGDWVECVAPTGTAGTLTRGKSYLVVYVSGQGDPTVVNDASVRGSYSPGRFVLVPRDNSATSSTLPSDPSQRKNTPIATGVIDYFPLALAEIARVSKQGNDQHNPGQPLHWDKSKSTDHPDCLMRHFMERGTVDTDGMKHTAKMAWRALALLQTELEKGGTK